MAHGLNADRSRTASSASHSIASSRQNHLIDHKKAGISWGYYVLAASLMLCLVATLIYIWYKKNLTSPRKKPSSSLTTQASSLAPHRYLAQ